jgi:hypothetical protein
MQQDAEDSSENEYRQTVVLPSITTPLAFDHDEKGVNVKTKEAYQRKKEWQQGMMMREILGPARARKPYCFRPFRYPNG